MTYFNVVLLILVWTVWCSLHSLMISITVLKFCEAHFVRWCKTHRLLYNAVSLSTFLAAYWFSRSLPQSVLFEFNNMIDLFRWGFQIIAILLFIAGGFSYDMGHFIGWRQLVSNTNHRVLTKSGEFKADGLLKIIRHPWYLAAFILIWSRSRYLTDVHIIMNTIFTLYLILGTRLEERKLVAQYGERYQHYQREVSMYLPVKWIIKQIKKS